MKENFINRLANEGIQITEQMYQKFELYYELLVEWNEKINLTAITNKEEVFLKHFYDSICLCKGIDLNKQTLLDVGSGAGFPSVPLKIVFPDLEITIVDSLNKRITFLKLLAEKLDISVNAIHSRIEDFDKENRFDIVTARAVASLNVLCEFCIPFVKKSGYFLPLKSAKFSQELEQSQKAIKVLGGKYIDTFDYSYDQMERYILKIQKISETPIKYPRPYAQIKKTPL